VGAAEDTGDQGQTEGADGAGGEELGDHGSAAFAEEGSDAAAVDIDQPCGSLSSARPCFP
jgi:hypothetical protein